MSPQGIRHSADLNFAGPTQVSTPDPESKDENRTKKEFDKTKYTLKKRNTREHERTNSNFSNIPMISKIDSIHDKDDVETENKQFWKSLLHINTAIGTEYLDEPANKRCDSLSSIKSKSPDKNVGGKYQPKLAPVLPSK